MDLYVAFTGWEGLIGFMLHSIGFGIPLAALLPRAGLSRWWALTATFLPALLILLWTLAFRRWPGDAYSGAVR